MESFARHVFAGDCSAVILPADCKRVPPWLSAYPGARVELHGFTPKDDVSEDIRWLAGRRVLCEDADFTCMAASPTHPGMFPNGRASDDFAKLNLAGQAFGKLSMLRCKLSGVNMTGASMSECSFEGSDLTGAVLQGTHLAHSNLTNCKLTGSNLRKVLAREAVFNGADLQGADLKDGRFEKCHFVGAKLGNLDDYFGFFAGADFSNADLEGAIFKQTDLRGAKFDGANLRNCRFIGAWLTLASFRGADMQRASFLSSNLSAADLSKCALQGADFTGATLDDIALFGANLTGAVGLKEAGIRARVDRQTVLPDGVLNPASLHTPDDVITDKSHLMVTQDAPMLEGLRKVATRLGMPLVVVPPISANGSWPRDHLYKIVADSRNNGQMKVLRGAADGESLAGHTNRYEEYHRYSYQHCDPAGLPTLDGIDHEGYVECELLRYISSDSLRALDVLPDFFLQTGNLFITEGNHLVIGSNSLSHVRGKGKSIASMDTLQDEYAAQRYPKLDPKAHPMGDILSRRKAAKSEIAEVINPESVLVVPQWMYHIDLQMAYLGEKTFLIHSFNASLGFLANHKKDLQSEIGAEGLEKLVTVNQEYAKTIEKSHIDPLVAKMTKKGFKAVKCCGMLFEGPITNGFPAGLRSIFMNGITFRAEEGLTFITSDAHGMETHKRDFMTAAQEAGACDSIFLGSDDGSNPVLRVEQTKGGIRCLTNNNVLATLDIKKS